MLKYIWINAIIAYSAFSWVRNSKCIKYKMYTQKYTISIITNNKSIVFVIIEIHKTYRCSKRD